MGVDVHRRFYIAVSEPFLNFLHGASHFQHVAGTAMPKIMEPYQRQIVFLQELPETYGEVAASHRVAVRPSAYIFVIFVRLAKQELILCLLLAQFKQIGLTK